MTGVLIREIWTHRRRKHREEFYVMTEAEIGVMLLRAEEHQRPSTQQKLGERTGTDSPSEPPEGTNSASDSTSDFWLLNHERLGFHCCKPPGSVVLCYESPGKLRHSKRAKRN